VATNNRGRVSDPIAALSGSQTQSPRLCRGMLTRLRKSGKGPRIVQLTEHAVGVTLKDDREWTEARIRDGA
jgi:hypothetical protein